MIYVVYLTVIQCMIIGIAICAFLARKNRGELAKRIAIMEVIAVFMLYAACFYMLTQYMQVAYIFRVIFFILSNYLTLELFLYVVAYTEILFQGKFYHVIMNILITIDSLSFLINVWTHHIFELTPQESYYGRIFLKVSPNGPWMMMHFILFYFLLLLSLATLAWKVYQVSSFYRKKYAFIMIILVAYISINLIFFQMDQTLDYSLIAFGVLCISIFYYSIYYIPKGLLENTLALVIKDMKQGVACFDVSGKCVYLNDFAYKSLQVQDHSRIVEEQYFLWKNRLQAEDRVDWTEQWILGGEEHTFELCFQKLKDANGQGIGSFCEILDRTEEIKNYEEEHYKATHDDLTGLYNRSYFFERTTEMLRMHPEETYLMVCSDIHDFKLVNDLFGVSRGNEVLRKEADMLRTYAGFLPEDEAIFARLFGDKFALCIQKRRLDVEYMVKHMDHMRSIFSNTEFHMHLYVGIYEIKDNEEDPAIMCDKASIAIETLRGDYVQQVAYYDDVLIEKSMKEKRLVSEFDRAIQKGEFVFFLQPQADREGKAHGGEALVRWEHPEMGLLFPGAFISIFEKTGLIYRLDQYIWEAAARQLAEWNEKGYGDYYISVNISPMDFYYLDIYQIFTSLAEKYRIRVRNLKLEITETAIMSDVTKNLQIIKDLQEYGFLIEMDDFGSGYSSLNTLKDIPANVLKIDMGFLRETEQIERSRYILKSIISLAEMLGMDVITEGVETKEQVEMLSEMGCHLFQGYYFSKPIPLAAFEKKYLV